MTPFCNETSRIRRAFGFYRHEFENWRTVASGEIKEGLPPAVIIATKNPHWHSVGTIKIQERICKRCGLLEQRKDELRIGVA